MKKVFVLLNLFIVMSPCFAQVGIAALTYHDHTQIMKSVIANKKYLQKELKIDTYKKANKRPSGELIYRTLLKSSNVDSATKTKIKLILPQIIKYEKARPKILAIYSCEFYYIRKSLKGFNLINNKIQFLAKIKKDYKDKNPEIYNGIIIGIKILDDGKGVIYSDNAGPQDAGTDDNPGDQTDNPIDPTGSHAPNTDPDAVEGDSAGGDVLGAIVGFCHGGFGGAIIGAIVDSSIDSLF